MVTFWMLLNTLWILDAASMQHIADALCMKTDETKDLF